MSAVQQRARRGFSLATLLILSLSILLHLVFLRTVAGSGAHAHSDDVTPPPVLVYLQPAALPALPPPPAPKPIQPVEKRKPAKLAPAVVAAETAPVPGPSLADASPLADAIPADSNSGLAADAPAADQLDIPPPAQAVKPLRASPPPSALLHYNVDARRSDGNYQGTGTIRFTHDEHGYSVQGEVKLLLFSLLNFESSGEIAQQGLAPVLYTEKRFRKPSTNTHFQREKQLVSFSASTASYARSGNEQDRASIVWQLASLGRGDAQQLAPGTDIAIFVAGTRDGDTWHLQVVGEENLIAAGGMQRTVRVLRMPRPGSYEQRLDIWLAPDLQWYPVKLRFTEPNGDQLELSLTDSLESLPGN